MFATITASQEEILLRTATKSAPKIRPMIEN